jgi:hypothetical protein
VEEGVFSLMAAEFSVFFFIGEAISILVNGFK